MSLPEECVLHTESFLVLLLPPPSFTKPYLLKRQNVMEGKPTCHIHATRDNKKASNITCYGLELEEVVILASYRKWRRDNLQTLYQGVTKRCRLADQ